MSRNNLCQNGNLALAVCVCMALSIAGSSQAGLITTISGTRSVGAAATDFPVPSSVGHSSTAAGLFDKEAIAPGASAAGTILSRAYQNSFTPDLVGLVMSGSGEVSVVTDATGTTGFSVLADSFFDVFFEIDITGLYGFDAGVDWAGAHPPYGGFAMVELINHDDSLTLLSIAKGPTDPPGALSLSGFASLVAGVTYRLHAQAKIDGGFASPGHFEAAGQWDFRLTGDPVPEPASMALFGLGTLGLCGLRRRRIA